MLYSWANCNVLTFSPQNYFARTFYNLRLLSLFVTFAINFILLFYKVCANENENQSDDVGLTSIELCRRSANTNFEPIFTCVWETPARDEENTGECVCSHQNSAFPRNQPPKIPARRKRSVRRQNKRSQPNRDHNWLTWLCSRAVLFIRDAFNWRHQLTSTWASGCFQNCYRYISRHNLVLSTLFVRFFFPS